MGLFLVMHLCTHGQSSIPFISKQVAESIQNASPVALADELVTHLGVSLEG